MADNIIQTHNFNCTQCDLPCVAMKVKIESEESIFHKGIEYTGGLEIQVTHPEPKCSMFLSLNIADFLREALAAAQQKQKDNNTSLKKKAKPSRKRNRRAQKSARRASQ